MNFLHKKTEGLHVAAYLIAFLTIISFLIAILRDRFFAKYIGAGADLDIYISAFKIPDILFIFVLGLIASQVAVIPMIEKIKKDNKFKLKEYLDTLFYVLSVILVIGATFIFVFIPEIVNEIFGHYSPENLNKLIIISRILLIQTILLGISQYFLTINQSQKRFIAFSLSPILYNIGIIIGTVFLYNNFNLYGVLMGVIIGSLMHLSLQAFVLLKTNMLPNFSPSIASMGNVWETIKISFPRFLSLGIFQVGNLIIVGLISSIGIGILSIYTLADNLKFAPILIIVTSYSTAFFPIITKHFTEKNFTKFAKDVEDTILNVFLVLVPLISILIVLHRPIISLIYETGKFGSEEIRLTSLVFSVLVIGALGYGLFVLCEKVFYAANKIYIPLIVILTTTILKIVSIVTIIKIYDAYPFINRGYELIFNIKNENEGILLSVVSVIAILELFASIFIIYLMKEFNVNHRIIFKSIFKNFIAGAVFFITLYATSTFLNSFYGSFIGNVFIIGISILIAVIPYAYSLYILKNKEANIIIAYILNKIMVYYK